MADQTAGACRDVSAALDLAARWGAGLPRPGQGATAALWSALATIAAVDLQVARVVEPHLDALAILDEIEASSPDTGTTWGVFAAEAPGARLEAVHRTDDETGWRLDGVKPWCSVAHLLSHALVTAWDGDERRLFAVDLSHPGVVGGSGAWVARGLPDITSTSLTLCDVPARPVGEAGAYLRRDGFAWGGLGVAAVWYGGAVGVARRLARQAAERELDQLGQWHLGAVDLALHAARCVLADAAAAVDGGQACGVVGADVAVRARSVVAQAAETVLEHSAHAMGPAPLVAEEQHAARVADLQLYLRQHHAERDVASLGRAVVDRPAW